MDKTLILEEWKKMDIDTSFICSSLGTAGTLKMVVALLPIIDLLNDISFEMIVKVQ